MLANFQKEIALVPDWYLSSKDGGSRSDDKIQKRGIVPIIYVAYIMFSFSKHFKKVAIKFIIFRYIVGLFHAGFQMKIPI